MKRLIVTADDLGLHPGMTDGALMAHEDGIVTACSVSVCGSDAERAIDLVRRRPQLDAGLHLTLVEERPVLSPEKLPTLTGVNGRFPNKWPRFVALWLAGRIDQREVEAELRAQIDRARALGLHLTHLNSHQHLHMLPSIRRIVLRLASECGIGYVRTVRELQGVPTTPRRLIFALLGRKPSPVASVTTNESTIGVIEAGHLDESRLLRALPRVRGLTELVAHPGHDDATISRTYDWGYRWDRETRALCSPRVREEIERLGIELTRPTDL